MKIWILILAMLILSNVQSVAQIQTSSATMQQDSTIVITATVRTAWNNVYVELGGNGLIGSVNYERLVTEWLVLRIGLAPVIYPVGFFAASTLLGNDEYKFEIGVGLLANGTPSFTGIIGYRYQPKESGFLFRIGFTPIFRIQLFSSSYGDIPWAGMSFGYNF